MKPVRLLALALVAMPVLAPAQHKKKPSTPAVFANAQFVYVQTLDGDAFTPGLNPADRQAIADVQDRLRDWGRYQLTTDRTKAELIFVVRRGRIASTRVGGTGGTPPMGPGPSASPFPGQPRPQPPGASVETDTGSEDDMLDVHLVDGEGKLGGSVWTRSMTDGLEGPRVLLVQQLRAAVEKDYPR